MNISVLPPRRRRHDDRGDRAGAAQRDGLVANRTPRLDHIAVQVPDVDEAAATLAAAGIEWTTEVLDLGGRRSVFSRPESPGGVVYQLVPA